MTPSPRIALLLAAAALALSACVSTGGYGPPGGYGDPYGDRAPRYPDERYPDRGYPPQSGPRVLGTVERVDDRAGRLLLLVDDPRSGRRLQRELRYDRATRLFHQGRELAVQGLERGDVVSVELADARGDWARTIEVVRDVRDPRGGGRDGDDRYPGELRGSVSYVDTRARLIRLDGTGEAGRAHVSYDASTVVEYRGTRYRPENLERGDRIRVQARSLGRDRWLAERILVERSVRD